MGSLTTEPRPYMFPNKNFKQLRGNLSGVGSKSPYLAFCTVAVVRGCSFDFKEVSATV